MKRLLLFSFWALITNALNAQIIPPPYINYQATLYDVNGPNPNAPYANQSFPAYVNITNELGVLIYQEEHFASTDPNGLVTIKMGDGLYVAGTVSIFNNIPWTVNKYYLTIDFVINGVTSSTAPEQLVTVPYAFHAGTAGNGIASVSDNGNGSLTFTYVDGSSYTTPILTGLAGAPGPTGPAGPSGASAYETWLALGNTGTEADFIASLTGPQGVQGPQGLQGAQGPAGNDGATGPQGSIGLTGPQGLQGVQGPAGVNGLDGVDGQNGASAYETWLSLGNTGSEADFVASLSGPQGPAGNDGATGPQGIQGTQGIQGPAGVDGANGTNGVDGQDGASAYETWLSLGNTGTEADFIASLTGPQGPAGNDGATGPQGPIGLTGPQGLQGVQGPAGPAGQGGVTTAGSNVTVTGTGIVGDPYVINADDNDWIINANDLYNANPGNIGIGTSTPSQLLELRGNDPNLLINSNSGAAYLQVNSAPSAEAGIQFQANGGNVWTMFRPSNTNDLRFYDGGFRVTFQNGGNVGIGTTAPEGILDVSSTTSGVIMPRMTAAQRDAIAVPVNGMMVYNTDENCMNFYQAGAWASFCGGGSGGSGSSSGSNANTLIYTTDGF
jgi:hypothetical protein